MTKEELQQLSNLITKYRMNLESRGFYRLSGTLDDVQELVDDDIDDLKNKGYLSCK